MAAAVFAFAVAQREAADAGRRRWMLAAWAAMALAVLSKGLVGAVLPVAAVGAYVLLQRDWKLLARLELIRGGLLFPRDRRPLVRDGVARQPGIPALFLSSTSTSSASSPRSNDRYQPAWFFIPVLLIGMLPWVVTLFPALWRALPALGRAGIRRRAASCCCGAQWCSSSSRRRAPSCCPTSCRSSGAVAARRGLPAHRGPRRAGRAGCRRRRARIALVVARAAGPALLQRRHPALAALGLRALDQLPPGWRSRRAAPSRWPSCRRATRVPAVLSLACGGLALAQTALSGHETLSGVLSAYSYRAQKSGTS